MADTVEPVPEREELLFRQECFDIVGACFEVYKQKGCGFLEAVYQECLEMEFAFRGIEFVAQPELSLSYRGHALKQTYMPDFICFGKIVVELKAVSQLVPEHRAQCINYLKIKPLELGLLANFGHFPGLEYERIVCIRGRYKTN